MYERQRFEQWAARELMDKDDDEAFVFRKHTDGTYKDKNLQLAYSAWKAAHEVDPERCDKLINKLDAIGRWCDPYDYGLPVNDEKEMATMRAAVEEWAHE